MTTTEWRLEDIDVKQAGRVSMLAALAAALLGGLLAGRHLAGGTVDLSAQGIAVGVLGMLVVSALVLLAHEVVHGLVIALCGVRPVFGTGKMADGQIPYLYAGAPGHHFSRLQYLLIAWAPSVVVNATLVALIAAFPWGVWLILPLAIHVSGCIGDWLLLAALHRQPPGTVVEDTLEGIRLHRPAATEATD